MKMMNLILRIYMTLNKKNRDKKIINNLYYFYLTFIGSRFKERLKAPHIKRLSKELMKMYRGDYQRLCVAMPPSA